ncbi:MAG: hypothetical protein AAFV46_15110, partial [Cyanobacteria bacterium J06635_11]
HLPKQIRRSMSEHQLSRKGDDPSDLYEIYLKGHLNTKWTDWFDGLTISLEDNGYTRLTGHIVDQSALHGLLAKIRDLGLPLISLMRVSSYQKTEEQKIEETETTDHEHLPHDT